MVFFGHLAKFPSQNHPQILNQPQPQNEGGPPLFQSQIFWNHVTFFVFVFQQTKKEMSNAKTAHFSTALVFGPKLKVAISKPHLLVHKSQDMYASFFLQFKETRERRIKQLNPEWVQHHKYSPVLQPSNTLLEWHSRATSTP
jgi:hypothetical protein